MAADDLSTRVDQAGSSALQSIDTYLIGAGTEALVSTAATAQGGNLTPAQLAAGAYGGAVAQALPSATPAQIQNAASASMLSPTAATTSVALILAAAVGAYFLFAGGSRRRA